MTRFLEKTFSVCPGVEENYRANHAAVFGEGAEKFLPCGHGVAWLAADKLHCGACKKPVVGTYAQGDDDGAGG